MLPKVGLGALRRPRPRRAVGTSGRMVHTCRNSFRVYDNVGTTQHDRTFSECLHLKG
jgi:hypothetical protein